MTPRLILGLMLLAVFGPAKASDWLRYQNERFGYEVQVPPGFAAILEAGNSDGGTSSSPLGKAELAVWGSNLLDTSFSKEIALRIAGDAKSGWAISYRTIKPNGAAWSGKRENRIVYVRAIPVCGDQAAFLQITYDIAAKSDFDPIVPRLAGSLRQFVVCH